MKRIVIRYGILMFLGFTGFFLIMHALNLSQHYHLRILNGIIHFTFITMAIKEYLRIEPSESNYMSGVAVGVITSMIGVVPFAIFQLIHLAINTEFMQTLRENVPYVGEYLTPFTAALTIFMEALAVSVIGSYIVTRIIDASMRKNVEVKVQEGASSSSSISSASPIPSPSE
ncbi:MAG TPA: hypothetical protein VI603_07485 [Saprospiraceae bacterium]|nr:hypothetical protein [Saprospiraceae bacterium]